MTGDVTNGGNRAMTEALIDITVTGSTLGSIKVEFSGQSKFFTITYDMITGNVATVDTRKMTVMLDSSTTLYPYFTRPSGTDHLFYLLDGTETIRVTPTKKSGAAGTLGGTVRIRGEHAWA